MGGAKEQLEKGARINVEGKYVCAAHFEDPDLADFSNSHAEAGRECSFCEKKPAAPLEDVVALIEQGIGTLFEDAAGVLAWDGREGGYQGPTYDTRDVLDGHIGIELTDDEHRESLLDEIVGGIDDIAWTDIYRRRPGASLMASWMQCCKQLQHGLRYFISRADELPKAEDDDYDYDYVEGPILSPPEILERVTTLCWEHGLVRDLLAGTRLFRAREQPEGRRFRTSLSLGPPPPQVAPAGRMNAAGIPIFYGAFERQTALLETASRRGTFALGTFRTLRPLRLVDLTQLPPIPGIFNPSLAHERDTIMFLHEFAKDITKPLVRDDRVHVEYVPSQVITEYIRFYFKPNDQAIDGVRYKSARNPKGSCIALFCTRADLEISPAAREKLTHQEDAMKSGAPWLKLVKTSTVSAEFLPKFTLQKKIKKE
jgi:hypothetical protein